MVILNLETKSDAQKRLKQFLEQNASESLADKINNGVYIEQDGKRLLNKKDLDGFVRYATGQAREQAAKGESGAFVKDDVVFGWLIHYYEENDVIGTLYNEDGSEYKKPAPVTTSSVTKPVIIQQPKPQMNIFDMLTNRNTENSDNSNIAPPQTNTAEQSEKAITPTISTDKPQKQPSPLYQTYLKLVERYKGFLILLRLGDFYEAFNDHATTLATELDLTLTGRDCGLNERVPMVGIPFHAVDSYVNKLVERKYKVILAEDLDNALEFKDIDEYEEPEEQMHEFDSYVDESEDEELITVSQVTEGVEIEDGDCTEILNAESAKAFNSEALCILSDLFDGEITLA